MAKFRSAVAIGVALLAFPASLFAASEESISIETLLKAGWQIAGYTSTLDSRSAFILFRHQDETYLVQCRASYDVTHTSRPLELLQVAIAPDWLFRCS